MTAKKLLSIDESFLPKNWKGATLADVTEYIQRGKGPKYIERSNLPVINQKCIRWFGIQKEHLKYVDPEQWNSWGEERYVRVGDVLWNSTGTGTIGRAALVRNLAPGEKYVVDSHVTIVRPRDIDPQYVHYWIMSPSVQGSIEAMQSGSTNQVELSKSAVEALPIPIAPPEQQKTIVAEIEKQFSRLDEAVANLKRVKANFKRYKASVLKAAVEGKLTEDWRKQHPDVEPASKLLERILAERRVKWNGRGKYKEPAKPDTSNLPLLPKHWTYAPVDSFLIEPMCNGISVKGSMTPPGVPALRLNAMTETGFDYSKVRYIPIDAALAKELEVKAGDFFVSRGNSLRLVGRGTVAQTPLRQCVFPDTMIRLRIAVAMGTSRWISTIWSAELIRRQIEKRVKTTAGIWKISQPELSSILLPVPPEAEQHRIVDEVERRLSVIEELEAAAQANLTRADRLRQSILATAFAGKLVKTNPARMMRGVLTSK